MRLRGLLVAVAAVVAMTLFSAGVTEELVHTAQAQTATPTDYDADDDSLIEVGNLAQLDAIRHDLDGDGSSTNSTAYDAAFPNAATGMGCPSAGCTGYELTAELDFDTNGNGEADAGDDYWNDGAGWQPIGTFDFNGSFSATFEGNGNTISGLFINRPTADYVGLFGIIGLRGAATVRNVGLTGVDVTGDEYVGGLTGNNRVEGPGTIIASYAEGTVSGGRNDVGGLVGRSGGTITASYAAVTVSGSFRRVGGLVGANESHGGTITASYAAGTVSGSSMVGGLVGANFGAISTAYATGAVSGGSVGGLGGFNSGTIAASYWDTETSGLSTSAGGEGKTTSELQSPTSNTGIYATWDDDVWDFGTSSEYPNLKGVGPASLSLGAPAIGAVTPGAGSLAMSWTAPSSDGGSAITAYDLRHIETSADETVDSNWTVVDDVWTTGGGTLEYTLTGLTGGTQYDLQVRAVNAEGDGPWSATITGTPAAPSDRDILIALYNATDGANWTNNTNWLSDEPLGDWHGVTTDDEGRVTQLRLAQNQLAGEMPTELGSLSNLTVLSAYFNDLTGAIPTELGNLSNLVSLELTFNDLTGSIPTELANLSELRLLNLYGNNLSGTIPTELGNLSHLQRLSLGGNDLTGAIPIELGNLSHLTTLELEDGNLTGGIPTELGSLSNLNALELQDNDLTGGIPTELGNLSHLTWLHLGGNRLTGAIPTGLGGLPNLTHLFLGGNQLTGAIPTELGNLSDLETLSLGSNELTGTIPTGLGGLSNLTHLFLGDNQLTGAILTELGNLSDLETLSLGSNELTGTIPPQLGNLSNLTRLHLGGNQLTGAIPSELGSLSNLRRLYIHDNQLSGALPQSFTNLTVLSQFAFSDNDGLCAPADNAFQAWLQAIPNPRFPGSPLPPNPLGPNCSTSSPEAPTIGAVTPGTGSLAISWTAPSSDGGSAITAYDLRHIETSADETDDSNWTVVDDVWTTGGGALQYTLTGLTDGTQYDLQVRAVNAEGDRPWSATATGTPTTATDYDTDDDGLIEVGSLAQLDAIRYDLDGDGSPTNSTAYDAAFPNAAAGMGCPSAGCTGYELTTNLDFDTNGNGEADAGDDYWNDGAGWLPIGESGAPFATTFDGDNHTISNLYIHRDNSNLIGTFDGVGLFGRTETGSIVRQVGVVSINVTGISDVGGLVGRNLGGAIFNSYVNGNVSGGEVGGLVGSNYSGTVANSHSSASVSGGVSGGGVRTIDSSGNLGEAGGLIGWNRGTVTDSYSTGVVDGSRSVMRVDWLEATVALSPIATLLAGCPAMPMWEVC